MDDSPTSILAIVGVVVSVGGSILAVINHTRFRSMCCGKKLEVSFDVEKTTPIERQEKIDAKGCYCLCCLLFG
jgi:hypothetical protein